MPVTTQPAKVFKGHKRRFFTALPAAKDLAKHYVKTAFERADIERPWSDAEVERYHRLKRLLTRVLLRSIV